MIVRSVTFTIVVMVLLLFFVTVHGASYNKEALLPRIYLTVFYESNCGDSKRFIIQQLQPALRLLEEFIILQLIPFGKSRSIHNGNSFLCQHGPKECLGNMVQNCALSNMVNRPDSVLLGYVACEMETRAGSAGDLYCVQKFNISVKDVERCVKWGEGIELQLQSEGLTRIISPRFIPTVTIDGKFNQRIQDSAQVDLIGTLCSILSVTRACAQHYNQIALQNLMRIPKHNSI